jgi:hypothetical protein
MSKFTLPAPVEVAAKPRRHNSAWIFCQSVLSCKAMGIMGFALISPLAQT